MLVSVVEKTQTAEIQNPNQFYQAQSLIHLIFKPGLKAKITLELYKDALQPKF